MMMGVFSSSGVVGGVFSIFSCGWRDAGGGVRGVSTALAILRSWRSEVKRCAILVLLCSTSEGEHRRGG